MADFFEDPDFEAKLIGRLQEYGDQKAKRTDDRIQENIVTAGRVDKGVMVRSTYHERTGDLSWRAGVRGPDYTIWQEDGFRHHQSGEFIEGAHFVRDAKEALEAGEL